MIPLQLTLKNFLSYRDVSLDFRGLHTACICGANGAGKSSLLEAITWVLWGETRASTEDDIINTGAENVRVDFQFICNSQTYRVIRSRQRGKTSSLDFQIASSSGFRTLNAKGLSATQKALIDSLRLDYDTFINSAYLRQGRADEFMQRKPSERKQILADLLKLSQYEELANQAKEVSKKYKLQGDLLEETKKRFTEQLQQKDAFISQKTQVEAEIKQLQQIQEQDGQRLQQLQLIEHQRKNWEEQLTWQRNQYHNFTQECDRLRREQSELHTKRDELDRLLSQEEQITNNYQHFLSLQKEDESLSVKFQAYQQTQPQKQQLEQKLLKHTNELKIEIQKAKSRLEHLQQQEQEIKQTLSQSSEVETALETLRQCRQNLNQLDKLQYQVSPLLQRRYTIQGEIQQTQARLNAKLEQLRQEESKLSVQLQKSPQIRQEARSVYTQIEELEKKKVYQKRLEEKGTERKTIKQQLEESQRLHEKQLNELYKKLEMLTIPEAICPLCERELGDSHRHHVVSKTQKQQIETQEQIWQYKEQISICERELQNLRIEYAQLNSEVAPLSSLQQYFGQLEAQLDASGDIKIRLNEVIGEIAEIEQALLEENYAPELQADLQVLNQQIENLNYNEQTHALLRAEEKRWRWAEIKQAKLEEANRNQAKINEEKPKILTKISQLENELNQLNVNSEIKIKINEIEQYLQELAYDANYHQNLRATLRQEQNCQLRYQQLQQAKLQHPEIEQKIEQVSQRLNIQRAQQEELQKQIQGIIVQIENIADHRLAIQELEKSIQQGRKNLDNLLAKKGSLEQSLNQLESIKQQLQETKEQITEVNKKYKVYKELGAAFGKNGIQTYMIENVLPQLEAETNLILSRLTGNQLHVQFLTQKSTKSKNAKLIDTLDILIADAKGTRPYETYSGGEAFRINFSIRLALAKLLAQRSGTSLQMLIVDEGFGTQDADGCDRLIAAINAISADFACILTVTHIPQFKEAFQHRIEVRKTNQGSQLILSN